MEYGLGLGASTIDRKFRAKYNTADAMHVRNPMIFCGFKLISRVQTGKRISPGYLY